jgi:hypothetical protein
MVRTESQIEQNRAKAQRVPDTIAAKIIGSKPATMRRWRFEGRGPRYLKLGGKVFYAVSDLDSYVDGRIVETCDSRKHGATS